MLTFKHFNLLIWLILLILFTGAVSSIIILEKDAPKTSAASEVVLQPGAEGKDAFISDWYPGEDSGDVNFGNEASLMVGAAVPTWFSYLQFDLSSIPDDATIESAALGVNVYDTYGSSNTFTMHRVTSSWNEDTITWNNQPSMSASYGSATVSMAGWTAFDVTSIVADSLVTDNGIALIYSSHSAEYPFVFYSSEDANANNRPKLTVTYSGGVSPATCTDSIQNQDETGVDCGGSCAACSTGNPKATHKACVNNLCTNVTGTGSDSCSDNFQCAAVPTTVDPNPKITHKICSSNKCQSIDGAGSDECKDDNSCLPIDTPDGAAAILKEDAGSKEDILGHSGQTENKAETALEKLEDFINDKKIPIISLVVAGILSVASAVASLNSFITAEVTIKEYLLTLINYFSTIFLAKKRDKQGLVFDASTGKPLAGALVNLYSFPEMRLISSSISDLKGRYNFVVSGGKYVMSVIKRGYIFPSIIAKRTLAHSQDIYLGITIDSNDDARVINYKIALDPTSNAKTMPKNVLKAIIFSNLLRLIIMTLGTIVAIVMQVYFPVTKNFLILVSYLVLWLLEFLIENREVKFCHIVEGGDKKPIDLALVRIMSEDGKLRQTYVSDQSGRVLIKSEKASDLISIERIGYQKEEIKPKREGLIEGKTFILKKI